MINGTIKVINSSLYHIQRRPGPFVIATNPRTSVCSILRGLWDATGEDWHADGTRRHPITDMVIYDCTPRVLLSLHILRYKTCKHFPWTQNIWPPLSWSGSVPRDDEFKMLKLGLVQETSLYMVSARTCSFIYLMPMVRQILPNTSLHSSWPDRIKELSILLINFVIISKVMIKKLDMKRISSLLILWINFLPLSLQVNPC